MSARQLAMKPAGSEEPLLLEKVQVRGSVDSTLARIVMRQEYRNDTGRNVEAIYTFPLPPSAVLLRTVVELTGKRHEGRVLQKTVAERQYEDAVAEGDTAIMVERPEPGIYTMNLGNLMAGESAVVEIEYGQLLDWSHDRLRLALPMTIAPRYGEERGALEPHARPHIDMLVERPFDLELRVGVDGSVSSPSHSVSTGRSGSDLLVTLRGKNAWMDRDFVLLVQAASRPEPFAVVASDADAHVGYVSFQIPEAVSDAKGRDVRLVIDCSGSMAGDSIALARQGAINLLNRLRPEDRFAVIAFGSTAKQYRATVVPASQEQVEKAIEWVQRLDADLGGTELAQALETVMEFRGARSAAHIFLVTDGQVGQSAETAAKARHLGHRVFVVGIGVSPSRGLLEEIAETTGGSIDYASTGEDAAEAIGRQFARITQMAVSECSVEFGADIQSDWGCGLSRAIYSGSTIHAFCHLDGGSQRSARVRYRLDGQEPVSFEVPCVIASAGNAGALPRIAASERIREGLRSGSMDTQSAEALAVEYQLVTALTNYVLVVQRGDARAVDMPVTTPVKTMLAAGWGGTGGTSIDAMMLCADMEVSSPERTRGLDEVQIGYAESFYEAMRASRTRDVTSSVFVEEANSRFGNLLGRAILPLSLSAVLGMRLPDHVGEFLRRLIDEGHTEEEVMKAFWAAFGMFLDPVATKRGLARRLRSVGKAADRALAQRILAELQALEAA